MDYAIILCFDMETEAKFNKIINTVSESSGNNYMLDNKIPPHITISYFCTDNINQIINMLDNNYSEFNEGEIFWASLGAFVPHTVFASPVLGEYLFNACVKANELVKGLADYGDYGQYLPNQWVPHTTLVTKLNKEEAEKAFNAAAQKFSMFGGKSNRLVLAECNPYKKIKTWNLV
ncbi:MAG: hypothetical protein FWG44_03590 [Oscillospiraceae bacterium]|nr:hypothetical protein [Oscillospiraceae bacterium]